MKEIQRKRRLSHCTSDIDSKNSLETSTQRLKRSSILTQSNTDLFQDLLAMTKQQSSANYE